MRLIPLALSIFLSTQAQTATLYVDPESSSPGSGYTTWDTAAHDISTGIGAMSAGDELVIRDGNYTGSANMINDIIPAGNYGADTIDRTEDDVWTTVRAETNYGVTVDGEQILNRMPLDINGDDYITVQGLIFKNGGGTGTNGMGPAVFVRGGSENIKLLNIGAMDSEFAGYDGEDSSVISLSGASYVLVQDSFAWGTGHYTVATYASDHIVYRRVVGRKDLWVRGVGSIFATYNSQYVSYQNTIAIDFDEPRHWHSGSATWGAYQQNGTTSNVDYLGVIAINIKSADGTVTKNDSGGTVVYDYNPAFFLNAGADSTTITDSAVIGSVLGAFTYGAAIIDKCTFASINLDSTVSFDGSGVYYVSGSAPIVTNSIFYDNEGSASRGISQTSSDYNAYYSNGTNYHSGTSARTNDYSSQNGNEINVLTNGLSYPIRIESGSTLKTAGSVDQIGAEITYKYGTDDTLWGQSGYNTLTANALWPYPNEDTIRSKMRTYNRTDPYDSILADTPVDGDRGFCADGETLTKYIWESLGNEVPVGLYASGSLQPGTGVMQSGTGAFQ